MDMTRRATRLRDEDKQDTDEWANLVKAYAILNQNDVVVAMGDGLQLQAQFSVLRASFRDCFHSRDCSAADVLAAEVQHLAHRRRR